MKFSLKSSNVETAPQVFVNWVLLSTLARAHPRWPPSNWSLPVALAWKSLSALVKVRCPQNFWGTPAVKRDNYRARKWFLQYKLLWLVLTNALYDTILYVCTRTCTSAQNWSIILISVTTRTTYLDIIAILPITSVVFIDHTIQIGPIELLPISQYWTLSGVGKKHYMNTSKHTIFSN